MSVSGHEADQDGAVRPAATQARSSAAAPKRRTPAVEGISALKVRAKARRLPAEVLARQRYQERANALAVRIDALPGSLTEEKQRLSAQINERKFDAAPPDDKEILAAARTVKPGKPTFRLTTISED